jgi:hypothetical protein
VLPAELPLGNVAEWVGAIAEWVGGIGTAGALLIALSVLLRDRGKAERAQVDLVGAWGEPTYERAELGEPRVENAEIRICVRNGSPLPIVVTQLVYSIHTSWLRRGRLYSYDPAGRGMVAPYFLSGFRVPPHDTWDATFPVKLVTPADALQLHPTLGVLCEINSVKLIDNVGDHWDIRLSNGGRAQRSNGPFLVT